MWLRTCTTNSCPSPRKSPPCKKGVDRIREKFIEKARSFLNIREGEEAHRKLIDTYNAIKPLPQGCRLHYTDPWCAAFVSAVSALCGLTDRVFPECGCERMIALYQRAGRWQEADDYRPRPGDLLFYDWEDSGMGDNRGFTDHVGLVCALSGDTLTLVEGNVGNTVALRTLALDSKHIRGYACPDFEGAGSKIPAMAEPAPAKTVSVSVPQLCLGAVGEAVRSLQLLLMGRGCDCGKHGADGDFGSATAKALMRYQEEKGLSVDGIAGRESWTSLLGGT